MEDDYIFLFGETITMDMAGTPNRIWELQMEIYWFI